MVATIRYNFTEAVVTYEEKPREQWIFDPPAQVKLTSRLKHFLINYLHVKISSYS